MPIDGGISPPIITSLTDVNNVTTNEGIQPLGLRWTPSRLQLATYTLCWVNTETTSNWDDPSSWDVDSAIEYDPEVPIVNGTLYKISEISDNGYLLPSKIHTSPSVSTIIAVRSDINNFHTNMGSPVILTISGDKSTLGLVPYVGATEDVDIGEFNITANAFYGDGSNLTGIAGSSYTGEAARDIGGISNGDAFADASMVEMWDSLLENFPVLIDPSSTFSASETGYQEVGAAIDITFTSTFDRGSIDPEYGCGSEYRSGELDFYEYVGPDGGEPMTTNFNTPDEVDYVVVEDGQTWQERIKYLAGVQPLTSHGNNYDSPLPAGYTNNITITITGVYPFFATTVAIGSYTKQPLAAHGSTIIVTMVAETGGDKQTLEVPDIWGALSTLEQYNDLSGEWDLISTATFDVMSTTEKINGNTINYTIYEHNGSSIGARELRFNF